MATVLAFDTSGAYCGAALFRDGDVVSALYEDMTRGQAERLFPMLEEVLEAAGSAWQELDAIGVGIGPGNFTGVRISVAAARGLSLSLSIPAVGVTVMEALAEEAPDPALLILSAPRGQVYASTLINGTLSNPALHDIDALPAIPRGSVLIGQGSQEIGPQIGLDAHPSAYAPASAIARVAVRRMSGPNDPPVPLYIRPADAAPPSDPPPVILP